MAPAFDPYSALGVPRDASRAQISAARRRLSRQYHPDVNSDPGAAARFAEVQQAFELLSAPAARAAYDRTRTATGREAAPGIFVAPDAVDFKVLRSGQPGTDAEITVSWTGQAPARITSGTEDDWWTTLRAVMPDPSRVVFSLRAQARAGTANGEKLGQFTVTLDDAMVAVALTARVEGVPPAPSAPVFPPARRPAPVGVRRRKSTGPAILGLITLGFSVFWAFVVQGGGGGTPASTETQTTPPVQPTPVPHVRAAAPGATPAFRLSSQYGADTVALVEAGIEGQPTLRGDELLLSVNALPGSPSSCIVITVPAADVPSADGLPVPAITEEPVGTVTVHGRAEAVFPAAIPGSYLVSPECQLDQSTDSLIPLGSVTAGNLGVIDFGHNAMVIFGAHTSGDVTTVSYGAVGDSTGYLYPPADDACIDNGATGSGQVVWQPVQDQVSQQVTSTYQWLRTGTMVFRDRHGQSPQGEFFSDCELDTPDEAPADVTIP